MKDFFPESLGQKCGYALYTGAHYTQQNMVLTKSCHAGRVCALGYYDNRDA